MLTGRTHKNEEQAVRKFVSIIKERSKDQVTDINPTSCFFADLGKKSALFRC